ncbi:MAG: hypothetical protein H6590_10345, partial [Flavobacteriales bacterium]|nr:hypothetical protein [Flavobacteriales bacterium]
MKTLKTCFLVDAALVAACFLCLRVAQAQTSAFTYQGQLREGGTLANGSFDLQFTLYDAVTGGTAWSPASTATGVAVTDGLFTTSVDFGSDPFDGTPRWIE